MAKLNTRLRTLLNNRSLSFWQFSKASLVFLWHQLYISYPCTKAKQHSPHPKTHVPESSLISTSSVIPFDITTSSYRSQIVASLVCCEAPLLSLLLFLHCIFVKHTLSTQKQLYLEHQIIEHFVASSKQKNSSVSLSCSEQLI